MGSTITAATMTVKLTATINLNGQNQGSSNTFTVPSVNEIYKRIVTCPANSETTVAVFHSSTADAALAPLDIDDVRYIRVTNKDASVAVTISLQSDVGEDDSSADESASVLLDGGHSFLMGKPNDGIGISDANASLVTDLVDLESIVVFTGGAAVDVEVFVASV